MRYTNGNYEAFARSRKPKNVEKKQAYIVGGGLAGLAAAVFLIRDGHMEGKKNPCAGGAVSFRRLTRRQIYSS